MPINPLLIKMLEQNYISAFWEAYRNEPDYDPKQERKLKDAATSLFKDNRSLSPNKCLIQALKDMKLI